jgi:hypothetical protein
MADFAKKINQYFAKEKRDVPKVQGKYTLKSTEIDKRDLQTFIDLYKEKPDGSTQVGNAETSLFWLFGGMDGKVTSTGGGYAADLQVGNNNIEVKAYNTKSVKIGRFQRQTEFLELVNTIFSVYNLVNDKQEIFSVFSFNYESLVKAAEEFCLIRHSLNDIMSSLSSKDKTKFNKIKIFNGILKRAEKFDEFAKRMGLEEICYLPGQTRPGGERIAAALLKFITEKTLMEKPGGENGYMAILPENFTPTSKMNIVKVIHKGKINLTESQINNIHNYVTFASGAMYINFTDLFS